MNKEVDDMVDQAQGLEIRDLLALLVERFCDRLGFATSFGGEDQVLTDLLCELSSSVSIFTLDTGRLPQETYDCMAATQKKYGVTIEIVFPQHQQVEEMVKQHGPNLFYDSVENRKCCCGVRKIEPLKRQLKKLDAWITGLRREQSVTRQHIDTISWDDANGLIKICPLANWTDTQVWDYIRKNDVPYNKLHDQGYPSIGCQPCTRTVEQGQDVRAGRWWWEDPEQKECGLHWDKR